MNTLKLNAKRFIIIYNGDFLVPCVYNTVQDSTGISQYVLSGFIVCQCTVLEDHCVHCRNMPDPQLEEQGRTLSDEVVAERSAIFVESPEINGGTM